MHTRTLAVIFTLAFGALPGPATAKEIRATIVSGYPPIFRWVQMIPEAFEPALAERLETSDHSIKLTSLFSGSIARVGDEVETVGAALAELGVCFSLFDAAKLPLQNISYYTPFVSGNVELISNVMDALLKSDPRMQTSFRKQNLVYLGAPVLMDDYQMMTKKPIDSFEDIKGKKFGTAGPVANWLSGTGGVPVSGDLTMFYNSLQTNLFEGVLIFLSAAADAKLHEQAPYITRINLGSQFAGGICANLDWYEALPADVRGALVYAADSARDWYLSDLEESLDSALEKMQREGAIITDASPEFRAEWANRMKNVAREWAGKLDRKGVDATGIMEFYMNTMREGGAQPLRNWDRE